MVVKVLCCGNYFYLIFFRETGQQGKLNGAIQVEMFFEAKLAGNDLALLGYGKNSISVILTNTKNIHYLK